MANVNTEVSQGLQDIRDYAENTEAIDILCSAILQAIKTKAETAGFDRTFQSVVTAVNGANKYTILDSGTEIINVPAYVGGQKIQIGSPVWVTIPSGNRSKMFISNTFN